MIKIVTTAAFLLCLAAIQAQIPPGYYGEAYNTSTSTPKTCNVLKTALFNIISTGTTELPYNAGSFDTWDALNSIDTQRNDANTAFEIWDMYTDNPAGTDLYSFTPVANQCGSYSIIGDCYNREHSFPQVWFASAAPMQTDLHHLFATDGFSNGKHDNFPYGAVKPAAVDWLSPAGARLGASASAGYYGKVFEPIDAYKGDFARAMFYMVTRYENLIVSWQSNTGADSVLNGTTWPALDSWAIKQWYQWHFQDPVSTKEINRNNKIYTVQNNRNPFVDHPEFVDLIWNCGGLLPVILTKFTAIKNKQGIEVKWNTTSEINFKEYIVERSTDGVYFATAGVVKGRNEGQYSFNDSAFSDNGLCFYRLKLVDVDGRNTYSEILKVKWKQDFSLIAVFPNPAANQISFRFHKALPARAALRIIDIAGRQVTQPLFLAAGTFMYTLKLNNLPAGQYVVSVISGTETLRQLFVISR